LIPYYFTAQAGNGLPSAQENYYYFLSRSFLKQNEGAG
jgi:hypothetical protein